MRTDRETRQDAARIARHLLAREIDFSQFPREFPDEDIDDDIEDLRDQMEHEPKIGGIFGVSETTHRMHLERTWAIIARLEND